MEKNNNIMVAALNKYNENCKKLVAWTNKHMLELVVFLVMYFGVFMPMITSKVPILAAADPYVSDFHKVKERTGASVRYFNPDASVLVVGDSRTIQMYNASQGASASFVAVWGGHYGYGNGNRIDSKANFYTIKRMAQRNPDLKIVVCSTINDYDGSSDKKAMKSAAKNLTNFVEKIQEDTGHQVYVTSCIKKKTGHSLASFNASVKKMAKGIGAEYISLPKEVKYQLDGVHFKDSTAKQVIKRILNVTNLCVL